MAEFAIRGGLLSDGTGSPLRRAYIRFAHGRISEIASRVSAPREIDAAGLVVAPGCIDAHTHYDA